MPRTPEGQPGSVPRGPLPPFITFGYNQAGADPSLGKSSKNLLQGGFSALNSKHRTLQLHLPEALGSSAVRQTQSQCLELGGEGRLITN
jgi:hypothetical protein